MGGKNRVAAIPRLTAALLAALVSFSTGAAWAESTGVCVDAAGDGQKLRDAHKLMEARDKFRVCAAAGCPAVVQSDCASWLDAVEKNLPTVVPAAKSPAGADLFDVKVTVDGQPLIDKLDGQAVPIDPGRHTFHFTSSDGTSSDRSVLVKEGEHSQSVEVILGTVPAGGPGRVPPSSTSAPTGGSDKSGTGTWKTAGWVVGGAGVVGLGIGSVFGVLAIGHTNDAKCNASNQCLAGPLSDARSAAVVSDVGFVAGALLLAGGTALVLFAPGGGEGSRSATVAIAPVAGPSGAGLALAGAW